jgi:hypothetical protein
MATTLTTLTTLFGQARGGGGGGGGTVVLVIYLIVIVLAIAGMWKVFTKAGQPGWGCIVPISELSRVFCRSNGEV